MEALPRVDIFGTTRNGTPIQRFTIENSNGSICRLITFGATITELWVADKAGKLGDVVLGHPTIDVYEAGGFAASIVGRVANRIAFGKFSLDGKDYQIAQTDGENALHGGLVGYHKRVWEAEVVNANSVRMWLNDPEGCEGFPGAVDIEVVYTFTNDDILRMTYKATSTQPTPVNFTNHAYFNLLDGGFSKILDHEATIRANSYTVVDDGLIPTGELAPVAGTPLDFTKQKPIGRDFDQISSVPVGYDHNYVLESQDGSLALAATVIDPQTGRKVECWTTEPGMQLYTGNFMDGSREGKNGAVYNQHHGFCLETQHYPDSINHAGFPSTLLVPGETYSQITEYRFGVV